MNNRDYHLFKGMTMGDFIVEFNNNSRLKIGGYKVVDDNKLAVYTPRKRITVLSRRVVRKILKMRC